MDPLSLDPTRRVDRDLGSIRLLRALIYDMTSLATDVTGWLLIAAAAMLWFGWTLLPVRIGAFFHWDDFPRVRRRLHLWIWLFRIHLFGHLMAVMGLVALATLFSESPMRIVLLPGVAVCVGGLFVAALAQAFYYHFGAWGAIDMDGKTEDERKEFVTKLAVPTEYITCLVRFGRVFFGLGQAVLAAGLLFGGLLPSWLGITAAILGVAAIALTMGLPDSLDLYKIIFHLNAVWLVAVGYTVLGIA